MKNEQSTTKIKAISFCRVSSKEQADEGYSLESQEKLLEAYATDDKRDYKIDKTYKITESASGKQIRKTFKEMLAYVTERKIKIILCEKIDRLTRNMKDASTIDDWVKDKDTTGRQVHFVKENFILNADTKAHDSLVWDMKVAIARFYSNNLSEEVRKGQKEKIAQGWLPTKPPLGYRTIGDKGHKTHVIDEKIAPYIRKMFELYATGNYSTLSLVKVMYKEGLRNREGKRVGKSRLHQLLSDPFYYGKMRWKGEITKAEHEPLIPKELFDDVQKILVRKIKYPMYRKHMPVFKAMLRCGECKGTVTWEIQKGHWYAHCSHYRNCKQKKYVRQEAVEEQLFPYFDKVAPTNPRLLQWLEKALKESHSEEIKYNTSKREELNRIIATADRRIEATYKEKLDGKMPADVSKKLIDDFTHEKEDALESLQKLSEARTAYYEAGYAVHELAMKAKEIYLSKKATVDDKRLLLSHLFVDHSLQDSKLTPNYTLAFDFLSEWMPKVNLTVAQTKNLAQGEVFSIETLGQPHGTARTSFSPDATVTASEVLVGGLSELRKNYFRTSENPHPISRFGAFDPKSRDLLQRLDSNQGPSP